VDEGAPTGPAADEEAAVLATQGETAPDPARPAPSGEKPVRLPPLDDLVARIPPAVRASLDDLFRAKFTIVRHVPPSAFK
jgi:hypothetical protein